MIGPEGNPGAPHYRLVPFGRDDNVDSESIQGGDEADALFGRGGLDVIAGGKGGDVIDGGSGNDSLSGSAASKATIT